MFNEIKENKQLNTPTMFEYLVWYLQCRDDAQRTSLMQNIRSEM